MIASISNISKVTEDKKASTESLVESAKVGGERLQGMVFVIDEINKSIDDIRGMAGVITGIASQTNLLSMNAAIEAAHAGETGKGFAVVADEIRRLSETSLESSDAINRVVDAVVERIGIASDSSIETSAAFDRIYNEIRSVASALGEIDSSLRELTIGGRQILEAVTTLKDISISVGEASLRVGGDSSEVSRAMKTVSDISSEVASGMNEIQIGTTEISQAAVSMRDLAIALGSVAEELDRSARTFTVSGGGESVASSAPKARH
ncbi:MAG: methyl-accepting chemotaxis protein [Spirochaetota bacterium]